MPSGVQVGTLRRIFATNTESPSERHFSRIGTQKAFCPSRLPVSALAARKPGFSTIVSGPLSASLYSERSQLQCEAG